jgi:hypothetical protein
VGESTQHQKLLLRLVEYVTTKFQDLYSLTITHDLPKLIKEEKPPMIGGFRPDLYGSDVPKTTVVVGEAKTALDLETEHSLSQYNAFLNYLIGQPGATFVISVEWNAVAAARRVFGNIKKRLPANSVNIIVIDETREYTI